MTTIILIIIIIFSWKLGPDQISFPDNINHGESTWLPADHADCFYNFYMKAGVKKSGLV